MATLFELSADDLYALVKKIRPEASADIDPKDAASLQSKVTEWLLLNRYSTLHKFAKTENDDWDVNKDLDCDSCKNFKDKHKIQPKVVVSQPTAQGEFLTFDVKGGEPLPTSPKPPESLASERSCTTKARECAAVCCRPTNKAFTLLTACLRRKA
ncbi:unnamed protein product, partial [Mesorhabditis spiculigera]